LKHWGLNSVGSEKKRNKGVALKGGGGINREETKNPQQFQQTLASDL